MSTRTSTILFAIGIAVVAFGILVFFRMASAYLRLVLSMMFGWPIMLLGSALVLSSKKRWWLKLVVLLPVLFCAAIMLREYLIGVMTF